MNNDKQYLGYVLGLLEKEDYLLGKELNEKIQKRFNINGGGERKVIQRLAFKKHINSSSPVSFGNGQFAYLHPSKKLDKDMVLKIAKVHRPALYRVLGMLHACGGTLSLFEAMKLGATPIKEGKSKSDSIEKITEELSKLKMAEVVSDAFGNKYLMKTSLLAHKDKYMDAHLKRLAVDAMFIPDIIRSLQRFNVIDNNNILYRSKANPALGVSFNNFKWDVAAYTKTTGINPGRASESSTPDKQTLVVVDIVVSRDYTNHDLQGFLSRIQTTQNSVKEGKRKILPIIVHSGTESKILVNRIKKLGFLSFDMGAIYGAKIYDVIKNMALIKHNDDGSYHQTTEEAIEQTLLTMRESGQEENLNSIKGDLFEFMMYPIIAIAYPNSDIVHSRKLKVREPRFDGKEVTYEYDYIVHSSRLKEIVVFELKGYASTNYISAGTPDEKNTLRWFFRRTFPHIQKQLRSENANVQIRTCYITTCKFNDDGIAFLNKMDNDTLRPSKLATWYDGEKLISLLEAQGLATTVNLIKKYYTKYDPDDEDNAEDRNSPTFPDDFDIDEDLLPY